MRLFVSQADTAGEAKMSLAEGRRIWDIRETFLFAVTVYRERILVVRGIEAAERGVLGALHRRRVITPNSAGAAGAARGRCRHGWGGDEREQAIEKGLCDPLRGQHTFPVVG